MKILLEIKSIICLTGLLILSTNVNAVNIVKNPGFELGYGFCGTGFNPADPGNTTGPYYMEDGWAFDWDAVCSSTPDPHAHVFEDGSCYTFRNTTACAHGGIRFADVAANCNAGTFLTDFRPRGEFTTGTISPGNYTVSIALVGIGFSGFDPSSEVEIVLAQNGSCTNYQVIGTFTATNSPTWQTFSANFSVISTLYDRVEIRIKDVSATNPTYSSYFGVDDLSIELDSIGGGNNTGCIDTCYWNLDGNTNSTLKWIGTNNNFDFPFHTNGTQKMNLTTSGALQIGNNPNSLGTSNLAVGSTNTISNNSGSNFTSGFGNTIQRAVTSIAVGQNNTISNPNGGLVSKSVALGWANSVRNHNQYIVGAANFGAVNSEYCGAFGIGLTVNQRGAWYFGGNAGTSVTNNTTNSLAIGWRSRHSALFNQDGLTLGTATSNTTNNNDLATARLDVNASNFTSFNGLSRPSGVRFRDLPHGEGTILVVDEQGYVYDSKIPIHIILQEEREKNEQLMNQINELSKKLEDLNAKVEELNGEETEQNDSEFTLFPNPNSGNFMIKHFIPANTGNAYLLITNQDGKQIMKKEVNCVGLCTSNINLAESLSNGTYFCSLFIDGKLKSSDKFILRK